MKKCSVLNCKNPHSCKSYCVKHYDAFRRHGDPLISKNKHGQNRKKHPLYRIYCSIRERCYQVNDSRYKGRGIVVCKGWLGVEGFTNFIKDMGLKPEGKFENGFPKYSIDRIDNDGNYSCGHCEECLEKGWSANCRWATWEQQSNNRNIIKEKRLREVISSQDQMD